MSVAMRAGVKQVLGLVAFAALFAPARIALCQERVRSEIPYREGVVVLLSDSQERFTKTRYRAVGHVEITFQDIVISCDKAEYDELTREGWAEGNVRFSQNKQWLNCSRAEFNLANQTGVFYDANGFTDREFLISGHKILKTGPDRYRIEEGFITASRQEHPKWAYQTQSAAVRVDRTARLHDMVFKIKGIPVFYAPYLILPLEKKERSSGLLPFRTGNSTSKGRLFSQGYFQTLGRSADLTIHGDYFTLRGLAAGGIFRARPNPQTRLYMEAYGISDRLDQGGAHLIVDGESILKHDFRAVAKVNVTSNFEFRQAFSDTFRSATVPQETALIFLTRNADGFSENFAFRREEVLFPERSVVIRKSPSIELDSPGKPIGKLFMFYLRSAIDGASRVDSEIETPKMVQRLDLYPRLELRIPSFAGFSLVPTTGVRETYYSAHLAAAPEPEVVSESFHRQYAEFELDLRTPIIEREFQSSWFGNFNHVIEPTITYRRITGVQRFGEIIRFDEEDVVADTNELEYGLTNRIFRERSTPSGTNQRFEFLSLSLKQKYYFDPTFGGTLRQGEPNIFYPLNTVTGFSSTSIERYLAPTSIILRVSPRPAVSYDVRADFDTKFQQFRDASATMFWQREKLIVAGTFFTSRALEPGTFDSNHIQGQVGYGSPLHGLSAGLTMSYNIQTNQLLSSNSRLNYMWDCCGVAMEFQQFDLGVRTESRFTFSFTLKGIGSFGNIKRPESLF